MAVTREVEVAIGTECGKHLVAGGVDGCSQVLYATHATRGQTDAPDVVAPQSARHVAAEVEPLSVRRYGGMGKRRQCVACQFQLRSLAPRGIAAVRRHDGGKAWIVGIRLALCQIHRPSVR